MPAETIWLVTPGHLEGIASNGARLKNQSNALPLQTSRVINATCLFGADYSMMDSLAA